MRAQGGSPNPISLSSMGRPVFNKYSGRGDSGCPPALSLSKGLALASRPLSLDSLYMAFKYARLGDPAGVGRRILVMDLEMRPFD